MRKTTERKAEFKSQSEVEISDREMGGHLPGTGLQGPEEIKPQFLTEIFLKIDLDKCTETISTVRLVAV